MSKKLKKLLVTILAALALVSLAACGGVIDNPANSPTSVTPTVQENGASKTTVGEPEGEYRQALRL